MVAVQWYRLLRLNGRQTRLAQEYLKNRLEKRAIRRNRDVNSLPADSPFRS